MCHEPVRNLRRHSSRKHGGLVGLRRPSPPGVLQAPQDVRLQPRLDAAASPPRKRPALSDASVPDRQSGEFPPETRPVGAPLPDHWVESVTLLDPAVTNLLPSVAEAAQAPPQSPVVEAAQAD